MLPIDLKFTSEEASDKQPGREDAGLAWSSGGGGWGRGVERGVGGGVGGREENLGLFWR